MMTYNKWIKLDEKWQVYGPDVEEGASVITLSSRGIEIHKIASVTGTYKNYKVGLPEKETKYECIACGENFTTEHALLNDGDLEMMWCGCRKI